MNLAKLNKFNKSHNGYLVLGVIELALMSLLVNLAVTSDKLWQYGAVFVLLVASLKNFLRGFWLSETTSPGLLVRIIACITFVVILAGLLRLTHNGHTTEAFTGPGQLLPSVPLSPGRHIDITYGNVCSTPLTNSANFKCEPPKTGRRGFPFSEYEVTESSNMSETVVSHNNVAKTVNYAIAFFASLLASFGVLKLISRREVHAS